MVRHPTIDDIRAAAARIEGIAVPTPLVASTVAGSGHAPVHLKLETEQRTGSFKVRGAANAMLQLSDAQRAAGVVAVSSGNHGRAVAYVAGRLGIEATVCLSSRVPDIKVSAIESLGAHVVIAGPNQESAEGEALRRVESDGLTFIHPFDDPAVIAGQGTIGLEILEQCPDVDLVVIPLSGGGLAGGVAVAVKSIRPEARVVGVSQDRGPAMIESIAAGRLIDVVEEDTLADALAGGLGDRNDHSFELCRDLLDETAVVSETEIAAAMAMLHRVEGRAVEGGGAVGVAALATGRISAGGSTVIVISGGNVDPSVLRGIAEGASEGPPDSS